MYFAILMSGPFSFCPTHTRPYEALVERELRGPIHEPVARLSARSWRRLP
jgi:hypothetical protein